MSGLLSVEPTWLRPSAIEACFRIGAVLHARPDMSVADAVHRLRIAYSTSGADYELGAKIYELVRPPCAESSGAFRTVLLYAIKVLSPSWLVLLIRGREAMFNALDQDVLACFEAAGGVDPVPTLEARRWLDALGAMARSKLELDRMESGREAEELTYNHELEVLSSYSYTSPPEVRWVSLDDNSLGYDIVSYRREGDRLQPRYIEVKGCRGRQLTINVTRNEWETASRAPHLYLFHVWDLETRRLHEFRVDQVAPHIPLDRGSGRWREARMDAVDFIR